MKAGEFYKVLICVDPRIIVTNAGTITHAVIYADSKAKLDALLTKNNWTRNEGFYYAPDGWKDTRLILPYYVKQPIMQGQYLQDPANLRTDFLYCGKSPIGARLEALRFGWRKRKGLGWTKS